MAGQVTRSTSRLVPAPDVQSVARLRGGCAEKSEAPAATWVAVPVCEAGTRGLTTLTPLLRNEGAAVAKSTRGVPRSDSATVISAVKITPASTDSATVPTTPSIA
jgi:hypothetical protein